MKFNAIQNGATSDVLQEFNNEYRVTEDTENNMLTAFKGMLADKFGPIVDTGSLSFSLQSEQDGTLRVIVPDDFYSFCILNGVFPDDDELIALSCIRGDFRYCFNTVNYVINPASDPAPPAPTPTVYASYVGDNLNFGSMKLLGSKPALTIVISGTALTSAITITAPSGFYINEINTNSNESPIVVNHVNGIVTSKTIYVFFNPTVPGSLSSNVTIAATGATTVNVPVTGNCILQTNLQAWYDSKTPQPSTSLITDLQAFYQGLEDDGVLAKADFAHVTCGLESDEQRLTPVKTTGDSPMEEVESPTLDVEGITGNGTDAGINTKWNASADAVSFSQITKQAFIHILKPVAQDGIELWQGIVNKCIKLAVFRSDDKSYAILCGNEGQNHEINASVTDGTGAYLLEIVGGQTKLSKDLVAEGTVNNGGNVAANGDVFLLHKDVIGTKSNFSDATITCLLIGESLNYNSIFSRLRTYRTARGL